MRHYLHNFYWLYSIDLKSSNEITQSIIEKWIDNNGSNNFYNNIIENKCKIVYNDPSYWDLELYSNYYDENNFNQKLNQFLEIRYTDNIHIEKNVSDIKIICFSEILE